MAQGSTLKDASQVVRAAEGGFLNRLEWLRLSIGSEKSEWICHFAPTRFLIFSYPYPLYSAPPFRIQEYLEDPALALQFDQGLGLWGLGCDGSKGQPHEALRSNFWMSRAWQASAFLPGPWALTLALCSKGPVETTLVMRG